MQLVRSGGWAALLAGLLAFAPHAARAQSPCPPSPPNTIAPPNLDAPAATLVPDDACVPNNFPGNPIDFFDDYSWRAFIALVWPALNGQRGAPDPNQTIAATNVPLVFETYKADWETFLPDGTAPADWNSTVMNPTCPNSRAGDFVLAPISKFGNVGEAGVGDLASVLIAQNGTFVRYLAAYNRSEFEAILREKWYVAANLPKNPNPAQPAQLFPSGALDIKSSWIDMTKIATAKAERFHTRQAWLVDPISGKCGDTAVTVGLVGLHIVQKTPTRPQWIWSTFEQIDNVPPPGYTPPTMPTPPTQTFTFNDGTSTSMPLTIPPQYTWNTAKSASSPPPPLQVERLTPVHPNTVKTNTTWQSALRQRNSVWQFYQLTMTQWPVPGNTPTNQADPTHTFPGDGNNPDNSKSAYANTTLETWDQTKIRNGCMNCHNFAMNTDFLWSLPMNAFKPPTPGVAAGAGPHAPAFTGLRSLLQEQSGRLEPAPGRP